MSTLEYTLNSFFQYVLAGFEVLEIRDEPSAVEFAVAEVAHHRREPASSQQSTGVAHRVLAMHTGPIGERGASNDDRAEQLGPDSRENHHRPSRLAVADHRWSTVGEGMERNHALQESSLRVGDILDGLAGDGVGEKADEVAWVSSFECHADFTFRLEPTDAWAVAGARIDDHEGSTAFVNVGSVRWRYANECVVDGPRQFPSVHDEVALEFQDVGRRSCGMLLIARSALPEHVQEESPTLTGIDPIVEHVSTEIPWPARARLSRCVMRHRIHAWFPHKLPMSHS